MARSPYRLPFDSRTRRDSGHIARPRPSDSRDFRGSPRGEDLTRTLKLHVVGLTRNVNEDHVREIFEQYGTLRSCELVTDRNVGLPLGFAYVEYEQEEDAERAMDFMDGGQIDGNVISVKDVTREHRDRPRDRGMDRDRSDSMSRRRRIDDVGRSWERERGRGHVKDSERSLYRHGRDVSYDGRRGGRGRGRFGRGFDRYRDERPWSRDSTGHFDRVYGYGGGGRGGYRGGRSRSPPPARRSFDRYQSPPRRGRSPVRRRSRSPPRKHYGRRSSSKSSLSRSRSSSYTSRSRSRSRSRTTTTSSRSPRRGRRSTSYSSTSRSVSSRSRRSPSRSVSSRSRSVRRPSSSRSRSISRSPSSRSRSRSPSSSYSRSPRRD